ncbi:hypothetical protein GCM10009069_27170 [Algimonas arctica]|uniref:DUF805 domain-containing protein n=1 Tax=Algimonas arctica TaxID=1479486 RepID=A0A8J3CSJ7_9PROT|nr:DUF805 domain-containing protein [Algimonas arctica]GHB02957.1 hypothetical protein GCM10009069_27170 [Algimonas arctica]
MFKTALYHLFVPSGRTDRKTFWLTLAVFSTLVVAFRAGLFMNDPAGVFYFWGFLIWMTMLFCGTFAVYGKRLKDFGRSVLMIILLITAILAVLMVIMLANGGAEYFDAYSQYDRQATIDPEIRRAINARYQEQMASAGTLVTGTISAMLVGFTLWVGLTPGDKGDNRYGPPPR